MDSGAGNKEVMVRAVVVNGGELVVTGEKCANEKFRVKVWAATTVLERWLNGAHAVPFWRGTILARYHSGGTILFRTIVLSP